MVERDLVAEEERLIGGHRFDHLIDAGRGTTLHFLHELANAGQAQLPRQRKQAAFDQILLVGRQIETGLVFEEFPQVFKIGRVHEGPLTGKLKRSDGFR